MTKIPEMPEIPDEIKWTEDEWDMLDSKARDTIVWLANQLRTGNVMNRLSALELGAPVNETKSITFVAVGMRYRSPTSPHVFSENDQISLEKEDDNPVDKNAIKIIVDKQHVAYVGREYTRMIRDIDQFEDKPIRWVCNFPQSAKMKLLIVD